MGQKWHPRKSSKVMRQKFEGFVCPEAQAHSGYVAGQWFEPHPQTHKQINKQM